MLFALNLFGFDICQVYIGPQPHDGGEDEFISNAGGDFERREIPFGFSSLPYQESYEEEEEDDE